MPQPTFIRSCAPATLPKMYHAVVVGRQDGSNVRDIALQNGRNVTALPAAGCLLRSEPGDEVAVCMMTGVPNRIVGVLNRQSGQASGIEFEHGLSVSSSGSVSLIADGALWTRSDTLHIAGNVLKASIGHVRYRGDTIRVRAKSICHLAGMVTHKFARLTERLGVYRRNTAGDEERHATSSRHLIAQDLAVKTGETSILAEETVKIDGEMVQLG